jgi:hypothetical protein
MKAYSRENKVDVDLLKKLIECNPTDSYIYLKIFVLTSKYFML